MTRAHVVLINANTMKPLVAPLALDYLAAALKDNGFNTVVLDLALLADFSGALRSFFRSHRADLVGITVRNTDDCYYASQDFFLPAVRDLVANLRGVTDAPIVMGGVGFSLMPEAILAFTGADLGVRGEGEEALCLLAGLAASGVLGPKKGVLRLGRAEDASGSGRVFEVGEAVSRELELIPGLVWRQGGQAGLFRSNTPRLLDLRKAGYLSRRGSVDNATYFNLGGQGNVETKRGCDQACIYCADPVSKGRSVRLRAPSDIVREFEVLLEQGVDCFHLCDAEFNLPVEHAREVCQAIIDRGLGRHLSWYTYASPAPFTEELLSLMQRAGCRGINFGVDNGSDRMLKALGRSFRAADIRETARLCRRAGMTFMFDLLLGGPGERAESVRETIELMRETRPDRVGVAIGVRVYPGTPLARMVETRKDLQAGLRFPPGDPVFLPEEPAFPPGERFFLPEEPAFPPGRRVMGRPGLETAFLGPVFFLSPEGGDEIEGLVGDMVGGDERFFFASREQLAENYNYNDNLVLVEAIKGGHRGAYWDILRRIQEGLPPLERAVAG